MYQTGFHQTYTGDVAWTKERNYRNSVWIRLKRQTQDFFKLLS